MISRNIAFEMAYTIKIERIQNLIALRPGGSFLLFAVLWHTPGDSPDETDGS